MSKQANIAIISGTVLACGTMYLIYKRNKNKNEVQALLDFVDKSYTQVNVSKATEEAIGKIGNTPIDPNRIHIGNYYGKYASNPNIRNELAKVVVDLNQSIKGVGTDLKRFLDAFSEIRNKNTMHLVDVIYKALYKQGLFEAMRNKDALFSTSYAVYNDNNTILQSIPFLGGGSWAPIITKFLQLLPDYN